MLRTGVYLGSGCESRFCIENLGILAMEHDPKTQRFADAIQALVMRFSDRKIVAVANAASDASRERASLVDLQTDSVALREC